MKLKVVVQLPHSRELKGGTEQTGGRDGRMMQDGMHCKPWTTAEQMMHLMMIAGRRRKDRLTHSLIPNLLSSKPRFR